MAHSTEEPPHLQGALILSLGQLYCKKDTGMGAPLRGTDPSAVQYGNVRYKYSTVSKNTESGKARIGPGTHRPTGSSFQKPSRISHGLPWALARLTMGVACSFRV
jgi:hypothetical protein